MRAFVSKKKKKVDEGRVCDLGCGRVVMRLMEGPQCLFSYGTPLEVRWNCIMVNGLRMRRQERNKIFDYLICSPFLVDNCHEILKYAFNLQQQ